MASSAALFELAAGFADISSGDTGHRDGSSDDHITQLCEQVVAATADPLREFMPCMPTNASAASPVSSVSLSRRISSGTSAWQACNSLI